MSVAAQRKSPRSRKSRRSFAPHKPHGVLGPRVQAVGPQCFGIVSIDPAKHRSSLIFCDFYGQVLLEPIRFDHTKGGLAAAVSQVREASEKHGIKDAVVAIERSGNYHLPAKRAPEGTKRFSVFSLGSRLG